MVTVVKPNKIRICIDPKDLNQAIKREQYPIFAIEEVISRLPEAKIFSKFDASSGFWQIQLDDEITRLPFGTSSAPEVFQKTVGQVFNEIDGVEVIMDDILVWGKDDQQHDERVIQMLNRTREVGLKLKKEKSKLRDQSLSYIGHRMTSDGVQPDPEKIRAITGMPTPADKPSIHRFLGMIQYLAKFIPDLSTTAAPLRQLLKKDAVWCWDHEHENAFIQLKQAIVKEPVLKFYDINKPVVLSVDSSSQELGAVLLQENQPVAICLTCADRNAKTLCPN